MNENHATQCLHKCRECSASECSGQLKKHVILFTKMQNTAFDTHVFNFKRLAG